MFSMNEVAVRLKQPPFGPVRLVTSSGESYEVTHPDSVLIGQREIAIGIGTPNDPERYTRLARISLLHITAMEDLPVGAGQQSQNGNGGSGH